jgi:flagellar biosynthesis/type III secretory pathway protein FliH
MKARLRLEVFCEPALAEDAVLTREEAEERALEAFEKGYAQGWDDAARAYQDNDSRTRAEIASHLQALSFGFIEAREHVTASLGPLLRAMVDKVLPGLAEHALVHAVLRRLHEAGSHLADTPVVLLLHPDARRLITPALDALATVPVTLRDDPDLGPGQIYLRTEAGEECIDVDRVLADIRTAVDTQFTQTERTRLHG